MFRLYMSLMIFICFLDKSQTFSFSIPQSCECRGSRGWKKSVIDAYSSKASLTSLPRLPSLPAHTSALPAGWAESKGVETASYYCREPNANVNELKLMHRFFYFARHAPQSAAGRGAASTAAAASNCIRLVQLHQLPRASSSTLPPPPRPAALCKPSTPTPQIPPSLTFSVWQQKPTHCTLHPRLHPALLS